MAKAADLDLNSGLAIALAAAQAEFPDIPRSKTVTVKTQSGGSYDFAYAPLDTIIKLTRPVLTKNGLAISQLINKAEGGTVVTTRLMHSGGEFLESHTPVVQIGSGSQAFGSALTYVRRYAYCAILCIQAEDDDDANAADGNAVAPRAPFPQKTTAAPIPKAAPAVKAAPDATPTAMVRIKSVEEKQGRTGATYYETVFLDGRKASTFNRTYAELMQQLVGHEIPAILTPSRDGRFLNIALPESLVESMTPPADPESPEYNDDGLGGFMPGLEK
jgi:hypothetical protein